MKRNPGVSRDLQRPLRRKRWGAGENRARAPRLRNSNHLFGNSLSVDFEPNKIDARLGLAANGVHSVPAELVVTCGIVSLVKEPHQVPRGIEDLQAILRRGSEGERNVRSASGGVWIARA